MTSFCRLPWQGLNISPQGNITPCCKYTTTIATSIDEYYASSELANLKAEFLAGGQPVQCDRCWQDEKSDIKSKRQIDYFNFLQDTTFDDTARIISFPFGNTCNLACRYCKSTSSSKWSGIEATIKHIFPEVAIKPHKQYYKNAVLIEQIKELSKDAVLIEFPGGEPFVTGLAEHKDYLQFLVANSPEAKSLHYTTNCTIFPDLEFWELWTQFKNVDIQLSLDGINGKFEYMRWPANWKIAYQNIKRYQENQKMRNNIQLSISHTVGALNVYDVSEFIDWCLAEGFHRPYTGLVSSPVHYNLRNLPQHVKEGIRDRLMQSTHEECRAMVSYMMVDGDNLLDKLQLWTTTLDSMRNQSFSDAFLEYSTILFGS